MNIAPPMTSVNFEEIERISGSTLAGLVRKIDEERIYPEEVMRAYGEAGAYTSHLGGPAANVDLSQAILSMARAAEECMSTAFCVWCQDTLGWYIASSDNDYLKTHVLPKVAKGSSLGGTGMSNPMKAIGEIEPMKLKGVRVEGGYKVKGILPWVSNLLEDGYFGTMFHVDVDGEDEPKRVMTIIHAAWEGVKLRLDHDFVAMGGTATCNVQIAGCVRARRVHPRRSRRRICEENASRLRAHAMRHGRGHHQELHRADGAGPRPPGPRQLLP
jgi:alkylation response protein AidB-like acyl-CoA dehydrogenase